MRAVDIIQKKRDGLASVSYTHLDVYKRQGYDVTNVQGGMDAFES